MKIRAKNFLSWENLEFDVQRGVTLITGFNHDDGTPEGSGKSAVLNALCWGLFGCMPKDANVDEVIREGTKSCSVEIELPDMTVVRARRPNDLHIKFGERIHRGKDAHETQKDVEKALGMTFETFCQSVYFAQNYPNKFVTANQAAKGKILSEILDLEQFDRARAAAQEKLKALKENIFSVSKEVELIQAVSASTEKSIETFESMLTDFHANKAATIKTLVERVQALESKAEAYVEKFEADKAAALKRLAQEEADLEESMQQDEKSIELLKQRLKESDAIALTKALDGLEEVKFDLNKSLNDVKVALATRASTIKTHEYKVRTLETNRARLKKLVQKTDELVATLIPAAEEESANLAQKLLKAEEALENPSSNCPTCGQKWEGDLSHFQKEVAQFEKLYTRAKKNVEDLKESLESNRESIESERATISEQEADIANFEVPDSTKLEKKQAGLENKLIELEAEMSELTKELRATSNIEAEMDLFLRAIKKAEKELKAKQAEQISVRENTPVEFLQNIDDTMNETLSDIERIDAEEPTQLLEKLQDAKSRQKSEQKKLKTVTESKKKLELESHKLEALRDGFKEVKAYAFQNTLNILSAKANANLAQLFEQPVKIQFKNVDMKIDVVVTIDKKPRSLGLYSGGQARRIHLAVDLALADIVMSRKGNKLPLMILDEYCKDLSEVSMEKVLHLLQARKGSTILIEHNSLFKSIVNQTFDVELIGGISRKVA